MGGGGEECERGERDRSTCMRRPRCTGELFYTVAGVVYVFTTQSLHLFSHWPIWRSGWLCFVRVHCSRNFNVFSSQFSLVKPSALSYNTILSASAGSGRSRGKPPSHSVLARQNNRRLFPLYVWGGVKATRGCAGARSALISPYTRKS